MVQLVSRGWLVFLVVCLVAHLFATTTSCATQRPTGRPSLERQVVLSDLKSPWGMAFVSSEDVLITEKEGGLILANIRTGEQSDVTGLPGDLVDTIRAELPFDNSGLFDVAIDPDFQNEPWVYLSYTAKDEGGLTTKVVRARLIDRQLTKMETLLIAEPFTTGEFHHYGGGLAFGVDGKLYVTVGERIFHERDNPDVPIAQDLTDRRGKIYRLNADGSIPDDNPDFGPGAVPGLYALGIRAAQGITLNPITGDLWFSEHGSRQGDEINRLVAGANYGWPLVTTGGYRNEEFVPPDVGDEELEGPIWSWPQTVAPTGLAFYIGDEFPEWEGDLFVSGLSRGSFWRMNFNGGKIVSVEELFVDDRVRSRDVTVAPDGSLYMLTDTLLIPKEGGGFDNTDVPSGQLLRIVRKSP
ncbi:MAG: PQQ-dependent sugar dehydrogenase [Pseudomonadota bacterium]